MAYSIILLPLVILAILLCISLPIFLGVFVYQDAKARGMEPLLWALIAVLAPSFIGLIIYLVVRRDHVVLNCPNCGGDVQENFTSCPQCGQKLSANCGHCGAALRPEWKLCPQCGTEITEVEPFTPPVISQGASSKKLLAVVVAILLIPVIFMTIVVGGYALFSPQTTSGYSASSDEEFYDGIAMEELRNTYDDRSGVFTVKDAELDKEATDWIAATKKNETPGFYAKTFYEYDSGEMNSDNGHGTYNITYACVAAVINPEDDSQFTYTDGGTVYEDGEWIVGNDIAFDLTELAALSQSDIPKDEQKEAAYYAKQYGNVFVFRFPVNYDVDFDFKDGNSGSRYETMLDSSINVNLVTESSKVTCIIPLDPDLDKYFNYLPTTEKANND